MSPLVFRRWASGWAALVRHHDVPGYRELGRLARLALELAVLRDALRAPGTWGAALTCSAVGFAAQILVWRLDLAGWRRDALLCLPLLLAAPWIAAGRRRRIAGLLARRGLPARGQA